MTPWEYLDKFPKKLLQSSEGRKLLTRNDPLLFAILYMSHHIRFGDDTPTLAQFHLDLSEYAKTWIDTSNERDCWIAPRQSGKTTWLFTILPLWAAAHEHLKFIAAFSDSADQATKHLQTFKSELDNNDLLRKDYPKLCKPLMAGAVKRYIAQSNQEIQQSNGFSFVAKGIDSKSLGLKIGNTRPDLLLLDDIEPNESNYSPHEAGKRLRTVLDSVFYLNDRARIVLIGTTTMSGSIIDQVRKVGDLQSEYAALASDRQADTDPDTDRDQGEQSHYVDSGTDLADNALTADKCLLSEVRTTEQSERNGENAVNSPRSDKLGPFGHPVAGEERTAVTEQSRQGSNSSGSNHDETNKSTNADNEQGNGIGTESLPLARFAKSQLDDSLPESLTDGMEAVPENDFNFHSLSLVTSIPNNRIRDFENHQQAELERLTGKVIEPNRGELKHEQQAYTDLYDFIDTDLHWVLDERIKVHYYPAIVINDDGSESSWWPEFKSLAELERIRHTRAFAMNYQNKPVNVDAAYWVQEDIIIEEADYVRTLLSIDPAVSTKTSNDYTALVVVSLASNGKVYVRHAEQVRYVSTELRDRVNELIERFDVGLVLCETNQGGMLWGSVFDGIKANYRAIHQTEQKTLRAARALDYYRKDQVRHTRHFDALEEQMLSFPKVAHDDLIDGMGTGVHYFLNASTKPRARKKSYI